MTPQQFQRVEEIYFRVRALPADQRAAALRRESNGDEVVRREVEEMLRAEPPERFLATPVFGANILADVAPEPTSTEDPLLGRTLGAWRIDRLIGSGGMGAVYLASRADGAFEGSVAIKVVKRGMDTDEILQRFGEERRTLANLKHPNIATLLDAGSLPDGRPYLVMEYVAGLPVTDYCREHALTVRQRLELFIAVCGAVQFAHQNLVVHRDLKPGNILVTPDGTVKLLDFGISRVLTPAGTTPAVTVIDERRLTPEYASPEQVEGRAVTTTADIYSLGVTLYELLSGAQPYKFETRTAAEIQRIVLSQSPPPPSDTAAARAYTGPRFARDLRGDLDNIVMMAMRKEPERRYASAERLASDIRAHLRGFPVSARRDTVKYRASKFVQRNRVGVAAAAAGILVLIAGAGVITWQANVAKRQRDEAFIARDQSEAISQFIRDMLSSANPQSSTGAADVTVREVLDRTAADIGARLRDQPLVQAAVRSAIGTTYLALGQYEKAEREVRAAYDQRLAIVGERHHDTLESMLDMASVMYAKQEFAEAEKLLRTALATFTEIRGAHNADVARTLNNLGAVLRSQGKIPDAGEALSRAIAIRRQQSPDGSLELAESLNNYAGVLRALQKPADAEAVMKESLEIRRRLLPAENPLVAQSLSNLGVMIASQQQYDRAVPYFREAIELELLSLDADHPDHATTVNALASVELLRGNIDEAEKLFHQSVAIREKAFGPGDPRVVQPKIMLGGIHLRKGRPEDAKTLVKAAIEALEAANPGGKSPLFATAADVMRRAGDAATAEQYDAKAPSQPPK